MRPMSVNVQPAWANPDASLPLATYAGVLQYPASRILFTADGAMLAQVPVQAGDGGEPVARTPNLTGDILYAAGRP